MRVCLVSVWLDVENSFDGCCVMNLIGLHRVKLNFHLIQ